MRLDLTTLAVLVSVTVGLVAIRSNPARAINRVFMTLSCHVALWLLAMGNAFTSVDGLWWLRITATIGTPIQLHLWLVKETVINGSEPFGRKLARGWLFATVTILLAFIPLTTWFVPAHSTASAPLFGPGYYVYIIGLILSYAALCRQTIAQIRTQSGSSRLELQVLLLGGIGVAFGVIALMGFRAVFGLPSLVRVQPLAVLGFYSATVVAMTTHRIFDSRQILLVCAEKTLLIALTSGVAYGVHALLAPLMPEILDLIVTTAAALWFAAVLSAWLDRRFHLYAEASRARQAAFAVAGKEARTDRLALAFLPILKGWGQSESAMILSGALGRLLGGPVEVDADGEIATTMRRIRWATPERLARERSTPERARVASFLAEHSLGVLVSSDGPTLKTLIGVGVPASRRPFTYPQVTQLLELAAIIEGSLERAHLSAKAQQAEQLATVGMLGAGVAHEIRNPLVSIKTFVQLLPNHYQDPVFRDKFFKLIGDEVTRIDRLTEQLLDLASPRVYAAQMTELHPVLRAGLDLVAARAEGKSVELRRDLGATPDQALIDPAAVKQVLLNLCFNAIHAVETQVGERWVRIVTRNVPDGIEMTVSDSGPGIAPEIRALLFQPFQSTKSSGFGLGLAICRDILGNLNSVITVDPPAPGRGATFRVVFPCRPS